jgi:hypothetical protein
LFTFARILVRFGFFVAWISSGLSQIKRTRGEVQLVLCCWLGWLYLLIGVFKETVERPGIGFANVAALLLKQGLILELLFGVSAGC